MLINENWYYPFRINALWHLNVGVPLRGLRALFAEDQAKIKALGRRGGTLLRLHDLPKSRPLLSVATAGRELHLTHPTVGGAMEGLVKAGILRETPGRQRGRLFGYGSHIDILSRGTEPLPR